MDQPNASVTESVNVVSTPAPAEAAPQATEKPASDQIEPTYTRQEILDSAASYGTTAAHLGAALHLLGRPDEATRADVEAALKRLDEEEG